MRLQTLAAAFAAPLLALAADTVNPDTRFQSLHDEAYSNGGRPIKLDETSYRELTAAPRNHTSVVLFTAQAEQYGCRMCKDFAPEWELLSKSWTKGDKGGDSKVLFGTLDFMDGRQVFQSLALQTAPILLLFPPTIGPHSKPDPSPQRYEFTNLQVSADLVHPWISRNTPPDVPKPPIRRPLNYLRIIITTTLVAGAITAATVAWPYAAPVVTNRNLWAAISLFLILLFTSGHMFNHIRQAPYVASDNKGGLMYFAPGFQNQFGLESQAVGVMYAILAFATITLALKVPRMTDAKGQQVAVFVWGAVMYGMYSFLLAVFRAKNAGYPFYLPPF